jgi:hypothetical protein
MVMNRWNVVGYAVLAYLLGWILRFVFGTRSEPK